MDVTRLYRMQVKNHRTHLTPNSAKHHLTSGHLAQWLAFIVSLVFSISVSAADLSVIQSLKKSIYKASNGHVNISGYINGHYMNHEGLPKLIGKNLNSPLWQIREASLFTDIILSENLLLSTEVEVSYDLSNKQTSGRSRRLDVLLNYYYLDFDLSSQFDWDTDKWGNISLRGGRIIVPFLSYNENKPNFKQHLMSQPFTAWQLAPVNNVAIEFEQFGWIDFGLTVNWNRIIEGWGLLDIKLSVINGLSSGQDAFDANSVQLDPPGMMKPTVRPRDGLSANRTHWHENDDNNSNKAVVLKTSFAPMSAPLDFGLSFYQGTWDDHDDHEIVMLGAHFNYVNADWSFKGEYVTADVEQIAGINIITAMGPAGLNTTTADYEMDSWYTEGSFVALRHGKNKQNTLRLILRLDAVDTNNKAAFTPMDRSRTTFGVEWKIRKGFHLRYEFQKHRIHSFDMAPQPYIDAGGRETIKMNMFSFIAFF